MQRPTKDTINALEVLRNNLRVDYVKCIDQESAGFECPGAKRMIHVQIMAIDWAIAVAKDALRTDNPIGAQRLAMGSENTEE